MRKSDQIRILIILLTAGKRLQENISQLFSHRPKPAQRPAGSFSRRLTASAAAMSFSLAGRVIFFKSRARSKASSSFMNSSTNAKDTGKRDLVNGVPWPALMASIAATGSLVRPTNSDESAHLAMMTFLADMGGGGEADGLVLRGTGARADRRSSPAHLGTRP